MNDNQRELFISLVFSGTDVDLAFLHEPKFTINEYEEALNTDEYKEFVKEIEERFLHNAELRLMGNLYRAEAAMKEVGPLHKNYPAIMKVYNDTLKLTSPIIEKLKTIKVETDAFSGLELVIEGTE